MAISNIVGRAEHEFAANPTNKQRSKELDKDAFLKLLLTQLGQQDPLNPMEDKEFTAQLAEFSSLEQLTDINEGIGSLNEGNTRMEMLSAVSFIGKEVRAEGDTISKMGDSSSVVYYQLDEPVANAYVNVFDSWGNVVRTIESGPLQAGLYQFAWDGRDYTGNATPDGVYQVSISAEGAEGQPVLVNTEVSGKVAGVSTENGQHYLRLSDGRVVSFMDVQEVVDSAKATPDSSDGTSGDGTETGSETTS